MSGASHIGINISYNNVPLIVSREVVTISFRTTTTNGLLFYSGMFLYVKYTAYTVCDVLCALHCTVCSELCALYSVTCAVCNIHTECIQHIQCEYNGQCACIICIVHTVFSMHTVSKLHTECVH